jgi:hypothetical protein
MMTDYKKRSSADFIITEGTSSRNGCGHAQLEVYLSSFSEYREQNNQDGT